MLSEEPDYYGGGIEPEPYREYGSSLTIKPKALVLDTLDEIQALVRTAMVVYKKLDIDPEVAPPDIIGTEYQGFAAIGWYVNVLAERAPLPHPLTDSLNWYHPVHETPIYDQVLEEFWPLLEVNQ
jgi:hypothetical protein